MGVLLNISIAKLFVDSRFSIYITQVNGRSIKIYHHLSQVLQAFILPQLIIPFVLNKLKLIVE